MAWNIPEFDEALAVCKEIEGSSIANWDLPRLQHSLDILKMGQRLPGPGSLFDPSFHMEIYAIAAEIHRRDPTQDRAKLGSWG